MNTRRDRLPDPRRIELAKGPMIRNFSYDVRIRGVLRTTGTTSDLFITIRSDRNMTPGEILEAAQEVLDTAPSLAKYSEFEDETTLTVVGARRRE